MEMLCGRIQRKTATLNMNFVLSEVGNITATENDNIDIQVFSKYYEHALKEEERCKELANLYDNYK